MKNYEKKLDSAIDIVFEKLNSMSYEKFHRTLEEYESDEDTLALHYALNINDYNEIKDIKKED